MDFFQNNIKSNKSDLVGFDLPKSVKEAKPTIRVNISTAIAESIAANRELIKSARMSHRYY